MPEPIEIVVTVKRYREPPSHRERVAAAKVRVRADILRGRETPQWIIELAKETT